MSRTYRARHTRTKISKKWADGSFTASMATDKNRTWELIAHGIFNFPCKIDGQLNAYPTEEQWSPLWTSNERTHEICVKSILRWRQADILERCCSPIPRYNIANLHEHPWINSSRSYKFWSSTKLRKGRRRR